MEILEAKNKNCNHMIIILKITVLLYKHQGITVLKKQQVLLENKVDHQPEIYMITLHQIKCIK
jgi:hypothetical protein